MSDIPEGLRYTSEHEWVRLEGDACVIGVTDYAQGELGDIVFVELPEVGDRTEQGEVFGTVEAVKTVADLYSPVTGEVVEVNAGITEDAASVNADPYGAGWMIKVRLEQPVQAEALLSAEAYGDLLEA